MIPDKEFERLIEREFTELMPWLIWQNDAGEYEAFGRYTVVPQHPGYLVLINNDRQGLFNSTRSAISWCVADKFAQYNLARDILNYDRQLGNIANDIFVRAGIAHRTKNSMLRENIETKLQLKIIHKREIEAQLNKCVNWAKYLQQKGFENETSRFGHATTIKTNRKGF